MNEPRMRAVPFQMSRAEGSDGLTLEGYAAVFNDVVRINDPWDGEYDEQFARGAFTRSIKARTPYLMFQHGRIDSLGGPLPIGVVTDLREDPRGLRVTARLHDNWLVQPIRDAIESQSLHGMSISFEPQKDTRSDADQIPLITRTEVKLLELGPVVMPAYPNTEVGVRSALAAFHDLSKIRVMTTSSVAPEAPVEPVDEPEPDPDAIPATSDEPAPEGTSDEPGIEAERASTPSEVLALLARNRARRYLPQGA